MSIGLVDETGRTYYAELSDYDPTQVDDWIKDNVVANFTSENIRNKQTLSLDLEEWFS